MKQIEKSNDASKQLIGIDEKGFVTLPFAHDDFKDFIIGLLGKPQTITKSFSGVFEIKKNHIINIHNLIDQRIKQQNDASLIRLNARVMFDDNSSILLRSLEELISYNEIKPIVSTGAYLSWQYLIKFNDKNVPERQEIEIAIISTSQDAPTLDAPMMQFDWTKGGFIHLNIKHTARTWGADIESLLSNHFNKTVRPIPKLYEWFRKQREMVAKLAYFLIMGIGFFGSMKYITKSSDSRKDLRESVINDFFESNKINDIDRLSEEVEFVTKITNLGVETEPNFGFIWHFVIIMIALIVGSIVQGYIKKSDAYRYPSFLILTDESEQHKKKQLTRQKLKWLSIIGSIILGVLSSLIASYLFMKFI